MGFRATYGCTYGLFLTLRSKNIPGSAQETIREFLGLHSGWAYTSQVPCTISLASVRLFS